MLILPTGTEGTESVNRQLGYLNGSFSLNGAHRTAHSAARAEVRSALSAQAPLREVFQSCTETIVRHLDAAAARIWLVTKDRRTLALQASSGANPTPGGGKPHIPVASPALRSIVEEGVPYVAQNVVNDPHLRSLPWAPGDRMAYAGHPLLVSAQVVGVLAVFSRMTISRATLETLRTIADMLAQAVGRTHGNKSLRRSEAFPNEAERLNSLLGAMRYAIDLSPVAPRQDAGMQVLRDRYASLSRRERDVMTLVVTGRLNKQVGDRLGISEITVKAHRGQVMRKMSAFSLADLVKIAVLLQIAPYP